MKYARPTREQKRFRMSWWPWRLRSMGWRMSWDLVKEWTVVCCVCLLRRISVRFIPDIHICATVFVTETLTGGHFYVVFWANKICFVAMILKPWMPAIIYTCSKTGSVSQQKNTRNLKLKHNDLCFTQSVCHLLFADINFHTAKNELVIT